MVQVRVWSCNIDSEAIDLVTKLVYFTESG